MRPWNRTNQEIHDWLEETGQVSTGRDIWIEPSPEIHRVLAMMEQEA
jgi:hypothetical protein